jgi:hypothetical protein
MNFAPKYTILRSYNSRNISRNSLIWWTHVHPALYVFQLLGIWGEGRMNDWEEGWNKNESNIDSRGAQRREVHCHPPRLEPSGGFSFGFQFFAGDRDLSPAPLSLPP